MCGRSTSLFVGAALLTASIASAQQPIPKPGSPGATTSISGKQLPPPPEPFGGKIERNASQSTPFWPPRVVPPKGAPNVLLIMIDDEGYGAPSTFADPTWLLQKSLRRIRIAGSVVMREMERLTVSTSRGIGFSGNRVLSFEAVLLSPLSEGQANRVNYRVLDIQNRASDPRNRS